MANGGGSTATATVTISGSEQSKQAPPTPPGTPSGGCTPGQLCDGGGNGGGGGTDYIYDSGTVTINIGGHAYTVTFNVANTNVAGNLAAAINGDSLGVATATVSGGTISLHSRATGSQVSFSLSYSWTWDTTNFSNPSFTASGPNVLSGGTDGPAVFGGHTYTTLYSYDALGNLVQVTQQGGTSDTTKWRVRRFTYDSLSRLLTANNPESGTISYVYDSNGSLTQKVMPSPNQTGTATHTISYCYDALNRVTGRAYSWQNCQNGQFPQGTAAVTYRYDEGTNGKGHLTSLSDQAGSATYTYDILGRMVTETRTIAGVTKNMSYTYNLDGSVATMTYPSGAVITYTPDAAGRVLSAVDTTNATSPINYVTGVTYNAPGALTGSTYGQNGSFTGIVNQFSFNSRLQPVNLWSASPTRTLMNLIYDFHVGHGDNGNVSAITNNRDTNRSQAFTYDQLNRLLTAQNGGTDCSLTLPDGHTEYWGNSYVYDAWGNLNQKQVTKCSAENLSVSVSPSNRLQGYSYDAAGNMTQDNNGTNYVYDAENRISSASGFTYVYDADGNRVQKTNGNLNPATGTLYWYMASGIVAESDLSGTLQSEYVFFGGERVARKDFLGNAVSYYFSDHLKTASVISDAIGSNIKSESDYYPWGGELQFTNSDSNHYKFTGKERDAETGLDYFGARHYSNSLGRFITPDWATKPVPVPYADLTDPQSLNQFTYVRNLPTTKIDADGHQDGVLDDLWHNIKEGLRQLFQPGMDAKEGKPAIDRSTYSPLYRTTSREAIRDGIEKFNAAMEVTHDVLSLADFSGMGGMAESAMRNDPAGFLMSVPFIHVPGGGKIAVSEAKVLVGGWSKGTLSTVADSLRYHFGKHGAEVGAKNVWQYMRKAEGFKSSLNRAVTKELGGGITRYTKNGKYIILDKEKKILSFGKEIK